jgi:hypothetical protein
MGLTAFVCSAEKAKSDISKPDLISFLPLVPGEA